MDKENLNGLVIVYKRDGRFFTGGIKNGKVVRYRPVKRLTDLKRRDDYVTLAAYLKSVNSTDTAESLLTELKLERLYILQVAQVKSTNEKLEEVGGMTEKAWEKVWWESFHPTCVDCAKNCKQSHMVISVICPVKAKK
jgi:hypothetical protein